MSQASPRNTDELLRQSLVKIKELKARVSDLEGARHEPIAIVGMACRFPGGAHSPAELWRVLAEGVDCIKQVPEDRWPRDASGAEHPGTRWAGLIDRVDGFDAAFFGISPREAQSMDPQHRLLLEVAWEALEDAAVPPGDLAGRPAGVFVGITTQDYHQRATATDPATWDAHVATGNALCFAAGRLSFTLGLQGPAMSIDTACSSSLVAIHLACASLRSGESEVALAGGVNLILSPVTMGLLAATQALSPDGRCKTFDASANGFVRAEGCGVLVLKRLTDAQRDEDRIWALIRGSAVNQDGRSTGLTTPNVVAQIALLRQALGAARLGPEDVGLIEAHGTGTSLGDPIEVEALRAVFGDRGRGGATCALGSVKTNLGHLEAAAGVAGIMKAALALHHGAIPRHLHFRTLNPRIQSDGMPFVIPGRTTAWPRGASPRVAGVSSFGMSGTNAHVLLVEAPVERAPAPRARALQIMPLSAASHEALRALAGRVAGALDEADAPQLPDLAHTARIGRAALEVRIAFVVESKEAARAALTSFAETRQAPGGEAPRAEAAPRVAMLFTGQGSQYGGMGRDLYETEPVYRDVIDRCEQILAPSLGRSIRGVLHEGAAPGGPIDQTLMTQPCLFALEVGLATLWQSWGVQPCCLLGHSVGEYVAAVVGGALTLEEGARLVATRARLIAELPAGGAMASITAELSVVEAAVAEAGGVLGIAAHNGPRSAVVTGEIGAVERAMAIARGRGVEARRMTVSHAFHSPLLEPVLEPFTRAAAEVRADRPRIPIVSNVTGDVADETFATPGYWRRHLLEAVRFFDGVRTACRLGCDAFVEIGPGRTLIGLARDGVVDPSSVAWLPSLRRGRDPRTLHESVAALWTRGARIDWRAYDRDVAARRVRLPSYPFQRRRHWVEVEGAPATARAARSLDDLGHPLLGRRLPLAGREVVFEATWSAALVPYFGEHRVFGELVVPATTYLEAARALGQEVLGGDVAVRELRVHAPLVFLDGERRVVQLVAVPGDDLASFEIFSAESRPGAAPSFRREASGMVTRAASAVVPAAPPPLAGAAELDQAACYAELARRGLDYGPSFRGLARAARTAAGTDAELVVPVELRAAAASYAAHPALLDAALQAAALALTDLPAGELVLPVGIQAYTQLAPLGERLRVVARLGPSERGVFVGEAWIVDPAGAVAAHLAGVELQRTDADAVRRSLGRVRTDWLLRVLWRTCPPAPPARADGQTWVLLSTGEEAGGLAGRLRARGARVVVAHGDGPLVAAHGDGPLVAAGAVEPGTFADLGALLDALGPVEGLVDLRGIELAASGDVEARLGGLLSGALALVQRVTEGEGTRVRTAWWITRGGQPVRRGEPVDPVQASLWGLVRVARLEHAAPSFRQLDLAPGDDAPDPELVIAELLGRDGEDQVALRNGERWVARISRRAAEPAAEAPVIRGGEAAYLVTGGRGAIGREVVRWLIARGAGAVVVASRRPPDADSAALEALGPVVCVQADVGTPAGVQATLAEIATRGWTLRGVLHAAGVLDDGLLRGQTPERVAAVLRAKAVAAALLDEATRAASLEIFVAFSSVASVFGSIGQAAYAAASAFLDGLAHRRVAEGRPGLSISWGMWGEGERGEGEWRAKGMAARLDEAVKQRLRAQGAQPIPVERGLELLEWCLGRATAHVAVMPMDWPLFLRSDDNRRTRLFDDLAPLPGPRGASSAAAPEAVRRVREASPEARPGVVRELLRAEVAAVLGVVAASEIDPRRPLMELGVDSMMAVELKDRLARTFSVSLSATLVYDYPSVDAMAAHVLDRVLPRREGEARASARPPAAAAGAVAAGEPIAIVGIGCRFPGGAVDPEGLWQLLQGGVDVIREVPAERWDVDAYFDADPDKPGKMYSRWGGFLGEIDRFDAEFFGIAPREALAMDPQQRLLLEVCFEAIEHAGIPREALQGSLTGVFVGIMNTEYGDRMARVGAATQAEVGSYVATGNAISVAAGRISYVFGLRGPTVALDTACSSSLVATHLACQALRSGEADVALAAGVNLQLAPETTIYSCRLQALSPTGRCKTFDAGADGYVRGDGCGVVVLKRLSQALADGDRVLAVIRGAAVNHDGRSSGLTAPNGPAQQEVIRRALSAAGVAPSEVGYLEAHGTGTALGDVIEVQALGAVLGEGRPRDRPLVLGTIKTNLGHTEGAAGVAGLLKAVLVLERERIPPHLHLVEPNPMIPWGELPVRVAPREGLPWGASGARRIVGVSSFGISGTNAHLILEAAPPVPPPPSAASGVNRPVVVALSGHTAEALAARAARLARHLRSHPDLRLLDVAFSAATGSTFSHRAAVVARDAAEAASALEAVAARPARAVPAARAPALEIVFAHEAGPLSGRARALQAGLPALGPILEEAVAALGPERGALAARALCADGGADPTAELLLGVALLRLLQRWGLEPARIDGVGRGAIAAAAAAGALDLEAAAEIVAWPGGAAPRPAIPAARAAERLAPAVSAWLAELAAGQPHAWSALAEGPAGGRPAAPAGVLVVVLGGAPVDDASVTWRIGAGPDLARDVLEVVAAAFEAGCALGFRRVLDGGRRVDLPVYPFQRQRYWIDAADSGPWAVAAPPAALPAALELARPPFAAALWAAVPARRRGLLVEFLQREVARALGLPEATPVEVQRGFFDLGMDSLMAVELQKRLQQELGIDVPASAAFDHPNVDAMARHLGSILGLEAPGPARRVAPAIVAAREPVAIVGVGLRAPGGANSVEELWDLLAAGRDGLGEVPRDRWDVDAFYDPDPDAPGKMVTRRGGFLRGVDVDRFDARFFGIAPREAVSLDPQQRLLLEVTWEALEDAGLPADRLVGSRTGVFAGVTYMDYAARALLYRDLSAMDVYAGTGNSFSMAAGRVAYAFGFEGPTMSIDATCASSLVAVHLGCQSLRSGEADLVVAGGVCLMLEPQPTVYLSKMRALSPDGVCRTFDAGASGYARGEGAGVVVLKRLSDALADGDRVLAVIRGSAVNHGGRASGLTVPNGSAQEAVIRAALADAGVAGPEIGYVEAHGTGTPLGDPIEARALGAVLAPGRAEGATLVVGSVKTNLGHLEAAAGVAGLIKTALTLERELIPPHLHFVTQNPRVSWGELHVEIPTAPRPWPRGERRRVAGVSSFGMSGTNAHVVLEEAPPAPPPPALPETAGQLLPLSARTPAALRELAARWIRHLDTSTAGAAALCAAAAQRRAALEQRVVLTGRDRGALQAALQAFVDGTATPDVLAGAAPAVAPGVAFVFSGHGSQWPAMGRRLLDEPAFAEAVAAVEAALAGRVPWSLREVLRGDVAPELLEAVDVVQPAIFAVQVGLAALWRSWGIAPVLVVGHSLGEIAAAHVAGALSLVDAVRVVHHRSRVMAVARGQGALALLGLSATDAAHLAASVDPELEVAAENGARATAVAGPPGAIAALLARAQAENVFARAVKTDVAFHSRQMEALVPELEASLVGLAPRGGSVPFVSSVEAGLVDGAALDASYWGRNLRAPVRFAGAMRAAVAEGVRAAVELSPRPVLGPSLEEALAGSGPALAGQARDDDGLGPRRAAGALWANGVTLDWPGVQGGTAGPLALPTYPWQRERYWIEALAGRADDGRGARVAPADGAAWRYAVDWIDAPRAGGAPRVRRPPACILVGDGSGLAARVAARLRAEGTPCQRLTFSDEPAAGAARVAPLDPLGFDAWLDPDAPPPLLVYLAGLDVPALTYGAPPDEPAEPGAPPASAAALDAGVRPALVGLLHLAQALVRRGPRGARLWILTRGAEAVGDHAVAAGQALLWGLGRSLALEQPDRWGGLLDLDPQGGGAPEVSADAEAARLIEELLAPDGEDQLALRGARRVAPRLVPAAATPAEALTPREDETVLVTGGLGGLGIELSSWLVARGWRSLILTSRRGLPPRDTWDRAPEDGAEGRAIAAVRRLEAAGARVAIGRADAADEEAMRRVLADHDGPPVRVLLHAAGAFEFRMLPDTSGEDLLGLVRPKLLGGWVLRRLFAGAGLRAALSFSSIAGICGSGGMVAYGAANHALDALAADWRRSGVAATAVSWGRWEGEGMGQGSDESVRYLERIGMRGMAPARALAELGALLGGPSAHAVVADVDWERYKPALEARRRIPLLAQLERGGGAGAEAPARARLLAAPPGARLELLREEVSGAVAAILEVGAVALDPAQGFFELGMDSLMSVELRQRLQRALGLSLPSTVAFEHASVVALTAHLASLLDLDPAPAAAEEAGAAAGALDDGPADDSEDQLAALLDAEISRSRGRRGR